MGPGRQARGKTSSSRVGVVSDAERKEAIKRRLESLERDGPDIALIGAKNSSRRTTRGLDQRRGVRKLDEILAHSPAAPAYSHIQAKAQPPAILAPRKLCSVCGYKAPYACSRCGSRFCCRKCSSTHQETRCLSSE